jgi:hypothetical protein
MSTVSSATDKSTGIADLMQMFSTVATPAVSSLLSSSKVQAALTNASPADLVQLSDQALQLQEVNGLFGSAAPTQTESAGLSMQNLLRSIYSPGSNVNLVA